MSKPLTDVSDALLKAVSRMFPDDPDDPEGLAGVRELLADCAPYLEECERRRREILGRMDSGFEERQSLVRGRAVRARSHDLRSRKKII